MRREDRLGGSGVGVEGEDGVGGGGERDTGRIK